MYKIIDIFFFYPNQFNSSFRYFLFVVPSQVGVKLDGQHTKSTRCGMSYFVSHISRSYNTTQDSVLCLFIVLNKGLTTTVLHLKQTVPHNFLFVNETIKLSEYDYSVSRREP